MLIKYNDNELLYLMSENEEFAFENLCEKYKPLIINRLSRFKIKNNNFEDFYQECLMVLYKCAINYREDKSRTFNVYLDISIQNRIKNLLRDNSKYFYGVTLMDLEEIEAISNQNSTRFLKEDRMIFNSYKELNSFEKEIIKKYQSGHNIKEIAIMENKSYHVIYRIINQYRNQEVGNVRRLFSTAPLSNLEKMIYKYNSLGYKPKEIALIHGLDVNIVYNALKRVKRKIIPEISSEIGTTEQKNN